MKKAYHSCTRGMVIKAHKCWWIKINTKPVRAHAWDGAQFPHIITIQYEVNGQSYTKKKFLHYDIPCPTINSNIDVYYQKEKPSKCIVKF